MASTDVLSNASGTNSDAWGFIGTGVATGLQIFDNIYGAVTGKPTPKPPQTPQQAAQTQNNILIFGVLALGAFLILRHHR